MLSIGQVFVLSLVLFFLFSWIFYFEDKKGRRFFLTSFRDKLDKIIIKFVQYVSSKASYLGRHIIKMSWYYSIHKLLRLVLVGLVKTYDHLEEVFNQNRKRAKHLKTEKTKLKQNSGHLGQMAEHKELVALSENEKKKLLDKKLEKG